METIKKREVSEKKPTFTGHSPNKRIILPRKCVGNWFMFSYNRLGDYIVVKYMFSSFSTSIQLIRSILALS
jgi:hypothetical protein